MDRIKDQAETLRRMSSKRQKMRGLTRVISFTSGKGGVGKTSTVVNTAISLANMGRSVLVLDADLGLANVDVMLGVSPRATLHDVFEGRKTIEEIMIDGPGGISIIPAASGVETICELDADQRLFLLDAVENVAYDFDYLLIDTQAGIGSDVMYFNSASSEIVCVINAEPTSLTDAYAVIKVLHRRYGEKQVSVLANNVPSAAEGEAAFRKLARAVERFLRIELCYLGSIPADSAVKDAIRSQRAVSEIYPSSPSALAISSLARKLESDIKGCRIKGGLQFFFRQLLEMRAHG